ncbi:MAG TPA: DMT family transporter [Nocardioidaceae bacterium]|nr:DMT family transporter [Nocardioidaceae bacterium]
MPAAGNVRRGYALVVVGSTLFVINAGVSRVIQAAGVDPPLLTSVRCTGTALVLLAVVGVRRERLSMPGSLRELAVVLGFGITGVALVQYFYFVAIDRLPVGIALLIEFTAPVLVALFSRFVYGEQVRRRMWLGIGCSLGGLALVAQVWAGFVLDTIGVLAGVAAALSLATYFLIGEHSVSLDPPLHVLTKAFVVAAVVWNVLAPVTGLKDVGLSSSQSLGGELASVHVPLWALMCWLIVLGTVVPFLAELSALRYLSATEVILIGMIEPVGATILGRLWFNESLTGWQVVGIATVLLGIILAQTARQLPPTGQPVPVQ